MNQQPALVRLMPNGGWDPRVLACQYELAYGAEILAMYVYVVVTHRYVVIVDTLVNEPTAEALVECAQPYLNDRQLLVINTHADYDHAWGNSYFDAQHSSIPAPIIGTRLCAERIRSTVEKIQLERLQLEQPNVYSDVKLVPPNVLFDRTLTIDGGDLTLQLFATPGHTPDHCSLYIPEIRTLLAGDAAECPFPSTCNGDFDCLRTSLLAMEALNAEVALYCHAPLDAGPKLLASNLHYLETLESRCRTALENGAPSQPLPDEDAAALVGFPFEEAVPVGAMRWTAPQYSAPAHEAAVRDMLTHLSRKV